MSASYYSTAYEHRDSFPVFWTLVGMLQVIAVGGGVITAVHAYNTNVTVHPGPARLLAAWALAAWIGGLLVLDLVLFVARIAFVLEQKPQ
ncbi:MAG TPA: hypothetical protein VE441_08385 [Mycobacterium sp.]|nr:hypothetical protein [Mycobacterium sp.]